MTETVGQNLVRKHPEALQPRERLSDEELGNLLSSVGNHEAKAVTLIVMRSGNIFGRGNLYGEVLNAQGDNKGWRMNKGGPFQYCAQSFAPIGLVAMEIINPDLSTYGYIITEDGKELGIPLAGLLLDFSERHNIPLNLLFGSTRSSSKLKTIRTKEGKDIEFRKRAPITTLKILYELLNSPNLPIREIDLEERIKSGRGGIMQHLIRLSKLGLIQYSGTEANTQYVLYRLAIAIPEGELPIYKMSITLTKSIFDVSKNHPDQYLTTKDIYNLLPNEQKKGWASEESLRSRISGVLSFLAKHKYVDQEKYSHLKQSEINITDEQRIVLSELLEIIYNFQNQDKEILEKGRRLAGEIISNPQRVSNLLRRAKEASSNANRSSQEETQKNILSIILSNPNGVTNKKLRKILEEKYDKRLGKQGISDLSSSLIKSGHVRVERKGTVNILYPINTEQVTA